MCELASAIECKKGSFSIHGCMFFPADNTAMGSFHLCQEDLVQFVGLKFLACNSTFIHCQYYPIRMPTPNILSYLLFRSLPGRLRDTNPILQIPPSPYFRGAQIDLTDIGEVANLVGRYNLNSSQESKLQYVSLLRPEDAIASSTTLARSAGYPTRDFEQHLERIPHV